MRTNVRAVSISRHFISVNVVNRRTLSERAASSFRSVSGWMSSPDVWFHNAVTVVFRISSSNASLVVLLSCLFATCYSTIGIFYEVVKFKCVIIALELGESFFFYFWLSEANCRFFMYLTKVDYYFCESLRIIFHFVCRSGPMAKHNTSRCWTVSVRHMHARATSECIEVRASTFYSSPPRRLLSSQPMISSDITLLMPKLGKKIIRLISYPQITLRDSWWISCSLGFV